MLSQKILIVDDSVSTRLSLRRTLENAGYEVVEAENGLRALELLDESIDLMVLDVNMPELDGYGVCERLREQDSSLSGIPILFLTTLETRAMEILGVEFGAYLNKSLDQGQVLKTVDELLDSKTSTAGR